jgi:hypothetical protein
MKLRTYLHRWLQRLLTLTGFSRHLPPAEFHPYPMSNVLGLGPKIYETDSLLRWWRSQRHLHLISDPVDILLNGTEKLPSLVVAGPIQPKSTTGNRDRYKNNYRDGTIPRRSSTPFPTKNPEKKLLVETTTGMTLHPSRNHSLDHPDILKQNAGRKQNQRQFGPHLT